MIGARPARALRLPFRHKPTAAVLTAAVAALTYLVIQPANDQAASIRPSHRLGTSAPLETLTFRVRWRVTTVKGSSPSSRRFSIFVPNPDGTQWMPAVELTGSRWTSWFTFGPSEIARLRQSAGNKNMGQDFLTGTFYLNGDVEDPTLVEGEVTLDRGERSVPITVEVFEKGFSLEYVLWREKDGAVNAGSVADFNQRYWERFRPHALRRSDRPRLFTIADRFDSGPDRRAWRDGLTNLASIGINTAVLGRPRSPLSQLLDESGIAASGSAAYCPPGSAFDYQTEPGCVWNERATGFPDQAGLDDWANRIAGDLRAAGFTPSEVKLFGIRDEPSWNYDATFDELRSNPPALERLRRYLGDQALTPADVGHSSWSEVYPVGRSKYQGTLEQRRLFYWSMRFFAWDSARHHAASAAALQRAFPGMSIFTNWNNFSGRLYNPASPRPADDPSVSLGGHDWFEFGDMRGGTTLWTEDWFGDHSAYQWSYYAQRLWAAAKENGLKVGGYVTGQGTGKIRGGLTRKVLSLVGHGGKEIFYYAFGPKFYMADGWSERSMISPIVGEISATNRLVARGEDLLWPGAPVPSSVAILQPRSAQMWDKYDPARPVFDVTVTTLAHNTVDYQAEARGIQLALQHANMDHDVISESQLNPVDLSRYKVLYVTQPNIPPDGQEAIASWTRGGGTLVKVSGAGAYDHYNDPLDVVDSLGGVEEEPRERSLLPHIFQPSVGVVTEIAGSSANAIAVRGKITSRIGSVQGNFSDGPAIVDAPVGAGRVMHFAFMPGLSYWASSPTLTSSQSHLDVLPTDFSAVLRDWIVRPVGLAGVKPLVETNGMYVEAPVLESREGAAITLLNWSNSSVQNLNVRYRLGFAPSRVRSATHGDLNFHVTGDGITFVVPLGAADVVKVYRSGSS